MKQQEYQNIVIELLSECNLECSYCMRFEQTKKPYKLRIEEIKMLITKLVDYQKEVQKIIKIKLSGGEPTLWEDGKYNIIDILKLFADSELEFSLVSNGYFFLKPDNFLLLESYFKHYKNLQIFFSIDKWHKNYSNDRCEILDNIIEFNKVNKYNAVIDTFVQTTYCRQMEYNLPFDFIKKYSKFGVKFNINPLIPWGGGKEFRQLIPLLELHTNDKSNLGDYAKILYVLGKKELLWENYSDYLEYDNYKLLKQMNLCGKNIIIKGRDVYFCGAYAGNSNFRICDIGSFDKIQIKNFLQINTQIFDFDNCDYEKLDLFVKNLGKQKISFDYGICGLCTLMQESRAVY